VKRICLERLKCLAQAKILKNHTCYIYCKIAAIVRNLVRKLKLMQIKKTAVLNKLWQLKAGYPIWPSSQNSFHACVKLLYNPTLHILKNIIFYSQNNIFLPSRRRTLERCCCNVAFQWAKSPKKKQSEGVRFCTILQTDGLINSREDHSSSRHSE